MPRPQFDRISGSYPNQEEDQRFDDNDLPDLQSSHNPYGSDIGNADLNDGRLLDQDYSLGGGVTMRRPFDHGFPRKAPLRTNHYGKGPKDWKRGDEKIFEDVCEALMHDHLIDASEIEVEVREGIVYLRGSVNDRPTKKEAESCVEEVTGVQDVINELAIRPLDLL